MKKTVQQHSDLLMVKLDEVVEKTLATPSQHLEYANDLGCTVSQVYLASARQNARAGRLFDTAVACICALAYHMHQEENTNDSTPSTPAAAGAPNAEAVDSGEQPLMG